MSEDRVGFLYGYVRAGGAWRFAFVAGLQSPTAAAREFRAADIQEENYPTVAGAALSGPAGDASAPAGATASGSSTRASSARRSRRSSRRGSARSTSTASMSPPIGDFAPERRTCWRSPFLFRSVDHLHKVLDGPIGERHPWRASSQTASSA